MGMSSRSNMRMGSTKDRKPASSNFKDFDLFRYVQNDTKVYYHMQGIPKSHKIDF